MYYSVLLLKTNKAKQKVGITFICTKYYYFNAIIFDKLLFVTKNVHKE